MSYRGRGYNDDDFGYSQRRKGRGNIFKYKGGRGGRGGKNFSKGFEKAVNNIRTNRYQDGNDFEELSDQDPSKWHKISVIFGAQCSRDWIISKVRELSEENINLVNYQTEGRNVVAFFKARISVVRKIRRQSHDFVDQVGKRLTVNITTVVEPSISRISDTLGNEIRECLNSRFSYETKVLDLSAFSRDTYLTNANLHIPLSRQMIAQFVVGILVSNAGLSELSGLILNNNDLETLISFKPFADKFPNMKMLDVSFNRLRHEGVLDVFRDCQIEKLSLQGNPFFRSQSVENYGTLIRERFPNLLHLNEKLLPPRMKFGVKESSKSLPEPTLGFFPNEGIRNGLVSFLKSYFEKYDSSKRDSLLDGYGDDATLTYCVAPRTDIRRNTAPYPDSLLHMSRNLLRVKDDERRKRMVFQGKLQVVSTLDRLPKTEHFLDSFRVDVIYNNDVSILMNVTGVLREIEGQRSVIRLFSRTMQITMDKIVIDHFTVTNPSVETEKKYREKSNAVKTEMSSSQSPIANHVTPIQSAGLSEDALVNSMMKTTGMNYDYAKRCLSEYEFNFERALEAFMNLKKSNVIPPDAFS